MPEYFNLTLAIYEILKTTKFHRGIPAPGITAARRSEPHEIRAILMDRIDFARGQTVLDGRMLKSEGWIPCFKLA
jgi:hypothetical protein